MKTKKAFGQYLVDKGLITEEVLLESILVRMRKTPSVVEIVSENKLISTHDLLTVLAIQSSQGSDFISACKSGGYWTPELEQSIGREMDRRCVPIVQYLVQEKGVSVEVINKALDSYLNSVTQDADLAEKSAANAPANTTDIDPPVEALRVSVGVAEFLDQFNESSRDRLVVHLEKGENLAAGELLHRFQGAAQFGNLPLLQNSFKALDGLVRKKSQAEIAQVLPLLREEIQGLWKLRLCVSKDGTEDGFKTSDPSAHQFLEKWLTLEGAQA